ncbi:hypothetical protein [Nocardioides taihuensis]|uniref:Uncharacterized protein n=1 Tax=Nocardioides taihuensis TaxID=1835606 RepID=A0ABW0BSN5_9ACTN
MVLDVDFAPDGLLADLLRAELDQGVEVHVVLLRPRLGWSTDAALVVLHGRRIAAARGRRLEELAHIAGARHRQVTVSIQRHRWRSAVPSQSLARYLSPGPIRKASFSR